MNNSKLTKLFLDLVTIPSPSGEELGIAKFIQIYLSEHDIKSELDKTGEINNSNSGNLIVKIKGSSNLPCILFVAHMDTVETGERKVQPVIKNGIIRSSGDTVLGADDKASIACLLQMLIEVKDWETRPNIIVVFTTREEQGRMGSSLLNISGKIDYCFNIDGSNRIGDFVYQTLGEIPFEIKLMGKAAHAAVEPEKGINAIKAAAILINKIQIGKNKNGDVLNIGKIIGGTANNIVPDKVVLYGQARAYSNKNLNKILSNLELSIKKICKNTGCSYYFIQKLEEGAVPAITPLDHEIVGIAKKVTKKLSIKPSLSKGSYTSDSNFLSSKYPTLTIGRGGEMAHSKDESIGVADLEDLEGLIVEIIRYLAINP